MGNYKNLIKRLRELAVLLNAEDDCDVSSAADLIEELTEERDALYAEVVTLRGVRDSIKVAMPDPEVFYICDRRACDKCNQDCAHTKDVRHAKHLEVSALGGFWEQEG